MLMRPIVRGEMQKHIIIRHKTLTSIKEATITLLKKQITTLSPQHQLKHTHTHTPRIESLWGEYPEDTGSDLGDKNRSVITWIPLVSPAVKSAVPTFTSGGECVAFPFGGKTPTTKQTLGSAGRWNALSAVRDYTDRSCAEPIEFNTGGLQEASQRWSGEIGGTWADNLRMYMFPLWVTVCRSMSKCCLFKNPICSTMQCAKSGRLWILSECTALKTD